MPHAFPYRRARPVHAPIPASFFPLSRFLADADRASSRRAWLRGAPSSQRQRQRHWRTRRECGARARSLGGYLHTPPPRGAEFARPSGRRRFPSPGTACLGIHTHGYHYKGPGPGHRAGLLFLSTSPQPLRSCKAYLPGGRRRLLGGPSCPPSRQCTARGGRERQVSYGMDA